jgi:integrase
MPVFPDALGGWRDPANIRRNLRDARGEFDWITSHAFRKTAASRLADAGVPTRQIADQLGHSRVSITQDSYMGRGVVGSRAAQILDEPGITGA